MVIFPASSFLAGFLGGELFLAVGSARSAADFFASSPSHGHAVWVALRSIAVYGLLFGAFAGALGGLLHGVARIAGRQPRILPKISGFFFALVILAYLSVWWQTQVLAGLPFRAQERLSAGAWHMVIACVLGIIFGFLVARWQSRNRSSIQLRTSLALALSAVLLWVMAEAGLRLRPADLPGAWQPSQIVVVGFDGMTLRVLAPMIRSGEAPTFRKLVDEGAWGSLLTYGVTASPVVWTSVATGRKAQDHGITNFVKVRAGEYSADTIKSFDRRVPAIWNHLSRASRRLGVVNWLVTRPPEPVNGFMVTGLSRDAEVQTHPPELRDEVLRLLHEKTISEKEGSEHTRLTDRVFALALDLLSREDLDFLALYDRASDNVAHRFWKYYQPDAYDAKRWDLQQEEIDRLGGLIPQVYRHLDQRLGELMQKLDEDALLIVMSDHGQLAGARPRCRLHFDRILAELGYAQLQSGEDQIDYSSSRAYSLMETSFSTRARVNVNQVGRENQGIVPPDEAPEVIANLARELGQIRFEDGRALFGQVSVAQRGSDCDIVVRHSRHTLDPDSSERLVEIAGRRRPYSDFADFRTEISGDHDHQGVIFLYGKGVRKGPIGQRILPTAFHEIFWRLTDRVAILDSWLPWLGRLGFIDRATTLDLTPTVLHASGLAVARDMTGRPLTEVIAGAGETRWVDSYDGIADHPRPPESPQADDEALERLRTLGYIN